MYYKNKIFIILKNKNILVFKLSDFLYLFVQLALASFYIFKLDFDTNICSYSKFYNDYEF